MFHNRADFLYLATHAAKSGIYKRYRLRYEVSLNKGRGKKFRDRRNLRLRFYTQKGQQRYGETWECARFFKKKNIKNFLF